MKRKGHLIEQIADVDNLYLAFHKACRGKQRKAEVLAFREHFDENIAMLRENVLSGHITVGNYHYFTIYDPKERVICAAPFRERVLHQNAVMGRGTKKDFIDVYFLLKHYSFDELIQFYLQKYTDGSEYRALLSMSYFADADPQPMPYMFQDVDWEMVKSEIKQRVELYNREHL